MDGTAADCLRTDVGRVALANPVLTASGTFGSGKEYEDFVDLAALGGVVTKSVTLQPTRGNPPPRVVETPAGMLNAIGLQNEGLDAFLRDLLPPLRHGARRVIVNIAGRTAEEYIALAKGLDGSGVDALEVNISCPNVKQGGLAFGTQSETAAALVERVRRATDLPLWVKLTPNVTDITAIARAVEAAGADTLTVANTFLGMAIDVETRRPLLANVTGGLSGPAVHPLALRLVWQVRQAVSVPIVGVGGVARARDVIDFLLAGASAVEVGTMNFVEPDRTMRLIDELRAWVGNHATSVSELIGGLRT